MWYRANGQAGEWIKIMFHVFSNFWAFFSANFICPWLNEWLVVYSCYEEKTKSNRDINEELAAIAAVFRHMDFHVRFVLYIYDLYLAQPPCDVCVIFKWTKKKKVERVQNTLNGSLNINNREMNKPILLVTLKIVIV